ncbi:phospholipase D-like domain-containing protein [Sinorhizobium alkalisoli]|uniref:Phospholipase D n=1 Tax=Sinorhizobium alkalisoli TaxID=1752398 RepID=A0A1E3VFF1_9HYPH|nr:phospholipase D-like domain-containing protein [Sinorhizobium alkalisoli]MCA1492783.1 PLDc N-terminal domain-containing protein [Ensifer sp. NBAIM29]MCG5477873.1 phosphatidylserine/phosphatidylglycerophosphate/cardiolipin synthase family protein [Sinorhizobium alkalisoli]ODR91841.1 cardiolipin synthase [Sinorhizobium alkalisoli]QFI66170.1 Cardiolipin synthetase [Sinorhizobium alkalisoli]
MIAFIQDYWPQFLALLSFALGAPAIIHAAMTKDDVRAAAGWVGVILLSPILGAVIYAVAGINRIRRSSLSLQRSLLRLNGPDPFLRFDVTNDHVAVRFGHRFAAMKILGDRVSRFAMSTGNRITVLEGGDDVYAAMLEAIAAARRSILIESYIFDRDRIGLRFADALIAAAKRGVEVRVLIDAVGARYSVPSIVGYLQEAGVPTAVFNGNIIMGLRLPYANLRTHRKIIVIDGEVAFAGGMNIRAEFSTEVAGGEASFDTHFQVAGPVVADIFQVAAEDWQFARGEILAGDAWRVVEPEEMEGMPSVLMRAVPSGPDNTNETNHKMLMGAFSIARKHIRVMSPYFLPDKELISALVTAARRGVEVDIVVPAVNNLTLVDRAMTAQFDQVLKGHCRVWRAKGAFNHSKLIVVDDHWVYVGSSNLDPRSLRLNFEFDLEILDDAMARAIGEKICALRTNAEEVTLESLDAQPLLNRLANRILWLGSPYL